MTNPKTGVCPICGAPTVARYRPFCSRRCADIDLGRWMTGAYALPAQEEDDPDEEERAAAHSEDQRLG